MWIILSISLIIVALIAYFFWRKAQDAMIEAEIEKIKIPDDTFEESPPFKKNGE